MSGHRHAAAALYGIEEGSRQAILARLAEPDRAAVVAHLQELRELGFDPQQVAAQLAPSHQLSAAAAADTAHGRRLGEVSAHQLYALLGCEAASVIAAALCAGAWSCEAELLTMFATKRREQIAAARQRQLQAPALHAALLAEISVRLPTLPVQPAPSLAARLRRSVSAWRR